MLSKLCNDILIYNIIPYLNNSDRHDFNIAYHKFPVVIQNEDVFGPDETYLYESNFKSNKFKGCLPLNLTITRIEEYYDMVLFWKHNIIFDYFDIDELDFLKIEPTTQSIVFSDE